MAEYTEQETISDLDLLRKRFKSFDAFTILDDAIRMSHKEREEALTEKEKALEELTEVRKERDTYKEKYERLTEAHADQSIMLNDYKKRLIAIQEKLRREDESNGRDYPPFECVPDICNYRSDKSIDDIKQFWNMMFDIKDIRTANGGYIIKGIVDVVPIFLVVSQSKDYDNSDWFFCGTQTSFCEEWNCFVADRESNPDRRVKLTCKPTSFNSALSKITYDRNPAVWKKNFRDGKSPINDYKRIINIKEQIMSRWH